MPIFFSERRFEVVTWGVGHQGLLLRSRHIDHEPRIEIWFKPAYAVHLSSTIDGLHITTPRDPERLAHAAQHLGRELDSHEHLYAIASRSSSGWVIGGSVSGRRDAGGHDAPTMFDGWEPREGVKQLFSVNAL